MKTRTRTGALVLAIAGALLPQAPAASDPLPQAARGVLLPVGFGFSVFSQTEGSLPTSLAWGPDTGGSGQRLYVSMVDGVAVANGFQVISNGRIMAFDDLGPGVAGKGEVVAAGLAQPLGIAFGPDKTLYVSENANSKGQISALRDGDGDGVFEQKRVVIGNLPNGRHQTNGMAFGPDGMLYVANGNATDDGLECGPPDGEICNPGEVKPWSGSIIRVNPAWNNVDLRRDVRVDPDPFFAEDGMDDESVLISPGYRNIYDVDFWPKDPSIVYTPMNGSDFPASSDPLFRTDVDDTQIVGFDLMGNPIYGPVIDDMGFPSCLYDPHINPFPEPTLGHPHPGSLEPQDNPNQAVIAAFGPCDKARVTRPVVSFAEGHEGTSGLAFERGSNFPPRYDSDLFVAEWGSIWNLNGGEVTGHKLIHLDIAPDGTVERQREFMSGVLPIDVTFGPDGAMYVADFNGLVYRVVHLADTDDPVTIEMRQGQFVPQVAFVPRATTVRWVNVEQYDFHNVRADAAVVDENPVIRSGTEINSEGDVGPGETHSFTFGELSGTWKYRSTTTTTDSQLMHGVVTVLPVNR